MHAYTKERIRKGMLVRLWTGKPLGKVTELGARSFLTDGGTDDVDYVADYEQVASITGDDIVLHPKAADATAHFEEYQGEFEDGRAVALEDEHLHLQRRIKKGGQIRLRKRVITERASAEPRAPSSSDTVAKAAFARTHQDEEVPYARPRQEHAQPEQRAATPAREGGYRGPGGSEDV